MSIKSFPISLFFQLQECNTFIPEKKKIIVQAIRQYLKNRRDKRISFYPDNNPDVSRLLSKASFKRPKATTYYNDGTARYYDVHIIDAGNKNNVTVILNDGSHIFDIEKDMNIDELISLISAIIRYDTIINK